MGRVYEARHPDLDRRYAVKVMFGDFTANDTMRARFAREARAASRLEHPNVVGVVDFGQDDAGLQYLVMDYVEGRTLTQAILTGGPLGGAAAGQLAEGLLAGLRHAHERGLVHRDLKPDNVMLVTTPEGLVPRIVDFGIALILDTGREGRVTESGNIVGTPAYMAPEQAFGGSTTSVDLYALGGVLFTTVCGEPPFSGDASALLHRKLTESAPRPADVRAGLDLPPRLEALIVALLARDEADRPASAADAQAMLRGEPVSASSSTPAIAAASGGVEFTSAAPAAAWADTATGSAVVSARAARWPWLAAGALVLLAAVGAAARWADTPEVKAEPVGLVEMPPDATSDPTPLPVPEDALGVTEPAGEAEVEDEDIEELELVAPPPRARVPEDPESDPSAGASEPASPTADAAPPPRRPRRPARAASAPPPPKPRPAKDVSVAAFTAAYKRVGAALATAQAADLEARYLRISAADAVRLPAVRREAYRTLLEIERGLRTR